MAHADRLADRLRRPAVAGTVALLLGTPLTGAAVGVVLAVRRADVRVPTVLGLLALAAGATLVIGGVTLLVRASRGWWRAAVLPSTALTAALGAYLLAVPVLVVAAVPGAPPARDPGTVGLAFEAVTIPVDGAELAAWYVPSRTGAAVVLLHGAGSTRASLLPHAQVLARHGYGLLLVDDRGHGASTGRTSPGSRAPTGGEAPPPGPSTPSRPGSSTSWPRPTGPRRWPTPSADHRRARRSWSWPGTCPTRRTPPRRCAALRPGV